MRIAYLYAIYNDGKINTLYQEYPRKFIDYLIGFDNIFTTNYDLNVELATQKQVYHIHGQFDKKSDVYLLNSFRNQLPDAPIKEIEIDENYFICIQMHLQHIVVRTKNYKSNKYRKQIVLLRKWQWLIIMTLKLNRKLIAGQLKQISLLQIWVMQFNLKRSILH